MLSAREDNEGLEREAEKERGEVERKRLIGERKTLIIQEKNFKFKAPVTRYLREWTPSSRDPK